MEKIKRLRKIVNQYHLDGYIIPKNDEFFGEYVEPNKDKLKYISNFSGSYGFALILKNKNYLFVDGRYTSQAKYQSGKYFTTITIPKKLPSDIIGKRRLKIGFDPKLFTRKTLKILFKEKYSQLISTNTNLIGDTRVKKINNSNKKFYILSKKNVGQSYKTKIKKVINFLKNKKVDLQFISASENVAWLLNIRGKDSNFSPIPNSYLAIDIKKKIYFFCDLKKIDSLFKSNFKEVKFIDIEKIEIFLSKLINKRILVDQYTCSIFLENILRKYNKITYYDDPIYSLKSIKTKIEIKNTMKSHIQDGAALTKFLFWVKNNFDKISIDELSAERKLFNFRKKNKDFKFLSFPTISGVGSNAAIIHYKASKITNKKLKRGDIYLVDSGGQYKFGTTDVTRTISLDNKEKRVQEIFTRVLKGHIAVAKYKIKNNTVGAQIDLVARKPLREINLDYAHGTGHGVGYFLNVHEGPQAITKKNKVYLREGMIVSNEPGYYENGKFGIRIENLISVKKNKKGYSFFNLTMAPIDKTLINKKILAKDEINWINEYHNNVFKNLKKFMNKSELLSLRQACSKI